MAEFTQFPVKKMVRTQINADRQDGESGGEWETGGQGDKGTRRWGERESRKKG